MVTLTWYVCKYKVHKFHQRYILKRSCPFLIAYHKRLNTLTTNITQKRQQQLTHISSNKKNMASASQCTIQGINQ